MKLTIEEIKTKIKGLEADIKHWKEVLDEQQTEENTQKFLNQIHDMSDENTLSVYLYSDTKTTPIMDNFSRNYKYLVFKDYYYHDKYSLSLILSINCFGKINYTPSELTMTTFKKREDEFITPLDNLILSIDKDKFSDGAILAFDTPCLLRGQTSYNQSNYGTEYDGYSIMKQSLYGDTNPYYFIGMIVESFT